MKPHQNPRNLTLLILTVVTLTFLIGTVEAFYTARAAGTATPVSPTPTVLNEIDAAGTATSEAAVPTKINQKPTSTPVPRSADTTGIIALASLIVMIIIVGASIGGRRPGKPKNT
jgi:hypothetical protein